MDEDSVKSTQSTIDLERREAARQASLCYYGFDTDRVHHNARSDFTRFAVLARTLTGAPGAAINIIDGPFQLTLAAAPALGHDRIPRSDSICATIMYSVDADDLFVTGDARQDPDLHRLPAVTGVLGKVRFYAAAVLRGREGLPLGTICVYSEAAVDEERAAAAGRVLAGVRDSLIQLLDQERCRRETAGARNIARPSSNSVCPSSPRAVAASPIHAIIDDCTIRTVFQPIVHLPSTSVVAYEALSRGPAGSPLESPLALIGAAHDVGRLGELDWLCRTQAVRLADQSGLPADVSWFINVEAAGLDTECPPHLRRAWDKAQTDLRVVLEIVERDVDGYVTTLLRAADHARQSAWGVALDDVGAEVGSLALLPFLRPDVVKLDMSLVQGQPTQARAEILGAVNAYAERTGAVILAEGIETPAHAHLARTFGATYGQGFLYGRPTSLPSTLTRPKSPIPLRQTPTAADGATPYQVLTEHNRPARAAIGNLEHMLQHLQHQSRSAEDGAVLLASFENAEHYQSRASIYEQISRTNAFTACLVSGLAEPRSEPRHYVFPDRHDRTGASTTGLIVVTPHFAGAVYGRRVTTDYEREPTYDYIYTHDRDTVLAAGRAFLTQLDDITPSPVATGSALLR